MNYITELSNFAVNFIPSAIKTLIYAVLIYWVYKIILWRLLRPLSEEKVTKKDKEELNKRLETLKDVFTKTGKLAIFAVAFMALASKAGLDVGPIIAGIGVIGIAVGFGAQSLVKDVVNGIFILVEGQFSKGDVVEIAGKNGQVEEITLRRTVLRDLDGIVHHIPNSEIKMSSNMSQKWSKVNINIPVVYEEKINFVYKILESVTKTFQNDKKFKKDILENFEIMGVDKFTDSGYEIKIIGKTTSMKRWDVARELRKRILESFNENGIKLPYPHRVMIVKDETVEKVPKIGHSGDD